MSRFKEGELFGDDLNCLGAYRAMLALEQDGDALKREKKCIALLGIFPGRLLFERIQRGLKMYFGLDLCGKLELTYFWVVEFDSIDASHARHTRPDHSLNKARAPGITFAATSWPGMES